MKHQAFFDSLHTILRSVLISSIDNVLVVEQDMLVFVEQLYKSTGNVELKSLQKCIVHEILTAFPMASRLKILFTGGLYK